MSDNDDQSSTSRELSDPPLKKAKCASSVNGRSSPLQTADEESLSSSGESNSGNKTGNCVCSEQDAEMGKKIYIAWQTQQMAKAVFDNTVNSMIENMSFPLPEMGDVMESYKERSGGGLEDQAVLMAIRSHGLQKPCSCSRRPPSSAASPSTSVPFHQRVTGDEENTDPCSSSSYSVKSRLEQDLLAEAVSVAIFTKGLGATFNPNR